VLTKVRKRLKEFILVKFHQGTKTLFLLRLVIESPKVCVVCIVDICMLFISFYVISIKINDYFINIF